MVGIQSVTCIIPLYSVPHRSSGMWLVEYTKAGTWKKIRDTCMKKYKNDRENEGRESQRLML